MNKLKSGQYVFKMKIPVTVQYSKRRDGTVSIDTVSVPPRDDIYMMVDRCAKDIKAGVEARI